MHLPLNSLCSISTTFHDKKRGVNPSCLFAEGKPPIVMKRGVEYYAGEGDQFTLLADSYVVTIGSLLPVEASKKRLSSSSGGENERNEDTDGEHSENLVEEDELKEEEDDDATKGGRRNSFRKSRSDNYNESQIRNTDTEEEKQSDVVRRPNKESMSGNAPMDTRPWCKYGKDCYRKNPQHLAEYRHY